MASRVVDQRPEVCLHVIATATMVDYTIVFKVGVYSRSYVDLLNGGRVTLKIIFQLAC